MLRADRVPLSPPPERLGDLLLDQLLQKLARPAAYRLLRRIEPLAPDEQIRRSRGPVSYGVVLGAGNAVIALRFNLGNYAIFEFPPLW